MNWIRGLVYFLFHCREAASGQAAAGCVQGQQDTGVVGRCQWLTQGRWGLGEQGRPPPTSMVTQDSSLQGPRTLLGETLCVHPHGGLRDVEFY